MGRVLYYDCFAGISGDMNLGALVDLGVPVEHLSTELARLGIDDEFELRAERDLKNGISGTRVRVDVRDHLHHHHRHGGHAGDGHHHHRDFKGISRMIEASGLSNYVKQNSVNIFRALAEAEGRVHQRPFDEVHFHEVGATDSIIDIVGSVIALEYLNVERIVSSRVELGSGTVKCQHGVMPVPAPATLILSEAFPVSLGGTDHEATTPTGAAFLAAMADEFEPSLKGRCLASGVGLGHRDSEKLPNLLRVALYETHGGDADAPVDCVLIETNIDDMTAERTAYLMEQLLEAGAMDAWQQPIVMKKGRLAVQVSVLCAASKAGDLREMIFRDSTTLGLRVMPVSKYELRRETVSREGPYGEVRLKRAYLDGEVIREKAEFDDCRDLSRRHGIPLGEITDTLQREY